MYNILFVCTGNTCRSCMAEGILNSIIKERGLEGRYLASSAGLYAFPGDKASENAVKAMDEMGIDIRDHYARQLNKGIIDDAYIIFAMTAGHKKAIIEKYPDFIGKVFTLKEYVDGTEGDIDDPYGGSLEIYRKCGTQLKEYIMKAMDKIMNQQGDFLD